MTVDQSLDWCTGCETSVADEVNLPVNWKEGDPLPEGLTIHGTARERAAGRAPFAFRGPRGSQDRVML
jgi:hypothetical protein